jgi:hypothetical protein
MLFHQISAEAELKKEIDAYLDKGLAHNRAIFVRALHYSHFQVRKAHVQIGGRKLARCSASYY